jgi:membrane protein required for colicin V production
MNLLDIVIIIVVVLLVFRGLWKGLVRQVLGIIGAVVAFIIAVKFSGLLAAKYLAGFQPSIGHIIMFLGIFLGCMVAVSLLAALIGKFTTAVGLGWLNRLTGGLLGGAKGYFVMASVVVMLIAFLPPGSGALVGSRTMKYVRPVADIISRVAPPSIKSRYDHNAKKIGHNPR